MDGGGGREREREEDEEDEDERETVSYATSLQTGFVTSSSARGVIHSSGVVAR
jgi:hypothetical protein